MLRLCLVLIALAISGPRVPAQEPQSTTADQATLVVRGQVRSGDDSAALLRRARVVVSGGEVEPVFTGADGRFEIVLPDRAAHTLRISKAGFAPEQVTIRAGAEPIDILVRLARGAAINGRVVDTLGAPAVDAAVQVRTIVDPSQPPGVPISTVTRTDDLGEFRVGSLPAGRYEVAVQSTDRRNAASATGADGPPLDGRSVLVQLRTANEAGVVLAFDAAAAEARSAAEYARGFEDGTRDSDRRAWTRARGTAAIAGRVTGANGQGVAGAVVRLTPMSGGVTRVTASSTQGTFQIGALAAGSYRLVATKDGFIPGEFGQERVGQPGQVIALADDQRRSRMDIGLQRGPSISGTVTDRDGEPLEGMAVSAWRLRYRDGRPVTALVGQPRHTDDRGSFRLHSLQPGTYYVMAADAALETRPARAELDLPRAYYPGSGSIDQAVPVRIAAGLDEAGADVVFAPAPAMRVTGMAVDASGEPLSLPVMLVGSTRSGTVAPPPLSTEVDVEGRFAFTHVPAGEYVLHAAKATMTVQTVVRSGSRLTIVDGRPVVRDEQVVRGEMARVPLSVTNHDPGPLTIRTAPGTTVTGRIVVEGGSAAPMPTPRALDVIAADPDHAAVSAHPRPWAVRINPDSTFEVSGLSGAVRFTPRGGIPAGWWLESVMIDGRNAADHPVVFDTPGGTRSQVDVVFSTTGAEVSGRVTDARDEPVSGYLAIAFPVDRSRWYSGSQYVKVTQPDAQARFTLGSLPPGDYFVVALDTLADASPEDPNVLIGLSSVANRVSLGPNERRSLDLPLARFR